MITFAEIVSGGGSEAPVFSNITADSVVFGPASTFDEYGTEDPRVTYDPATGLYYMFYTSYGPNNVLLSLATSPNPTSANQWTRYGAVFPGIEGSKSAALLIRDTPPHYLLWGDTNIQIANSTNLTSWPDAGSILLTPRSDNFDSELVESGPNPLLLSTGDYLFLYNSANADGYHPSWAILNGTDPAQVIARAEFPLFSPDFLWEQGLPPWTCNVPNVAFLQGVAVTEAADYFRVYFGGADTVVGSALIQVTY